LEMGQIGMELFPVQHHHAHVVSCMADNGLRSPVIGVVFDGTGLGSDGHIWGGEFLIADYHSSKRMGHLEYLPLPGGDAATRKPYRIAVAYLVTLLGEEGLRQGLALMGDIGDAEVDIIQRQLETGLNSPLTSSIGRLFDAVSSLLGIRGEIDYEGQAAIELEMAAHAAHREGEEDSYPYSIAENGGMRIVKVCDLFSAIVKDSQQGAPRCDISAKFHNTIAQIVRQVCLSISSDAGTNKVVLTGGVFQNRLLFNKTVALLERSNLEVYTHRRVPCNDGGISLGQAVIASSV
jgi:hydrogenase maturation protein HypF